ncbi:MAG: UvrD-helicase domain-containing protein [Syntrophaceae bacterium]
MGKNFYADLHVHSRFSRATSRELNLRALAQGALRKGIAVLGTGDFTHPTWMSEIEEQLVEAEPGLLRLKSDLDMRFMLTAEISTIYKQGDKVRKVHHLLVAPDLDAVRSINKALARIGNIVSDGRPILGLASRDLLEIVLQADPKAYLIPAHIWTPWFSALGSKSGFDSIAECYLDLEPYIFAVETGLSSDPLMNRRVRSLDRYHLVSNSDAHSAEKLGREATVFTCERDYDAIRTALQTGAGLEGTVEFFPEEGKYHLDGHRDCSIVLEPEETERLKGRCPVCGRALTVGVLSRVHALADRQDGEPTTARPFYSAIPLTEILGEILQVGPASGKVKVLYENLIRKLGPELMVLLEAPLDDIRRAGGDTLALAIERMRLGKVHKQAGFDGQFGRIRVFLDSEIDLLFDTKPVRRKVKACAAPEAQAAAEQSGTGSGFNAAQSRAIGFGEGSLIVMAGPGTGKTRVLTERIRALRDKGAQSILAVTFTTKACEEMRTRLDDDRPEVTTFHALAARIIRETGQSFTIADDDLLAGRIPIALEDLFYRQSTMQALDPDLRAALEEFKAQGYYTFEGLIIEAMRILETDSAPAWDHILVDEFQDINPLQYAFLKLLARASSSLMVIGDPHQAIYSFRGGNPKAFDDFAGDYPGCVRIDLSDTYRLTRTIARASNALIERESIVSPREGSPIKVVEVSWPPRFIAAEIETLLGGLSHGTVHKAKQELAPSRIAVIVRTRTQAMPVMEALDKAGVPYDASYARPMAEMNGIRQRLTLLEGGDILPCLKGVGDKTLAAIRAGGNPGAGVTALIARAQAFLETLPEDISSRIQAMETSALFSLPALDADHDFYQYARTFGTDALGFMHFCRLRHDAPAGEKVRVLTAHAAKGLEFDCVFIAGTFPLPDMPLWEERNLFYVAMTRARDHLYICANGRFSACLPREFIELYKERLKTRTEQMTLFE